MSSKPVALVFFAACLLAIVHPLPAGGTPPGPEDETDYPPADPADPDSVPGSPDLHWPPNMVVPGGTFGALPGAGSVDGRGQYQYRIPIDVPPGRLGMQPHLALVYSSGAGNDLLGVGWSLSGLSVIAPCLHRHATDQNAWFGAKCWNGKRLVEVPNTSPREYRTEEESFARIVEEDSDSGFTVDTKDGHRLVFRRSVGGAQLAAALLTEESDQRGNTVKYAYDVVSASEYYPLEITYTHRGAEPGRRTIRFGYTKQLRGDEIEVYSEGARLDTRRLLQTITASAPNPETPAEVWQYQLTYDVSAAGKRSLLASVVRVDQLGGRILEKRFHWTSTEGPHYEEQSQGTGGPIPGDVTSGDLKNGYLVADFDQDGRDDLIFDGLGGTSKLRIRHAAGDVPLGEERVLDGLKYGLGEGTYSVPDLHQARVGDVNGDGYLDIIAPTQVDGEQAYVLYLWKHEIGDFDRDSIVGPYRGGDLDYPMPLFLADMDGDGLPDIVRGYDPAVSEDPNEQAWTWYKWGVRLNDHQGGFGPTHFIAEGHALGGNDPPFTAYSASDSTGRTALFGMSTKKQGCSVTQVPLCEWETEDGSDCTPAFPGDTLCEQVCSGFVTTYSTHTLGHDFGVTLTNPLEVSVGPTEEDHTLWSLADVNGDSIDDVVTFKADTNEVCIRAWGTGGDLSWLAPAPCVKVETGRDPEPAVYQGGGSDTHCGYKTQTQPAPWRLRIWDVDGDGRHDVVLQHLVQDEDYPDDQVYRLDGEVHRAFLDATGTLVSGPFPLGNGGPYEDVGSVVGDFDGDGRLDILAFGEIQEGKVLLQKESTRDVLTGVVDGNAANDAERIEYSMVWKAAASAWPLDHSRYPLYVSDPRVFGHTPGAYDPWLSGHYPVKKIRRGLQVVRKHDVYQGDDIGAYVHNEYAYADPTFDLRGRGFLGFRVVDHFMPDVPSEEVTFYDNLHNDYDPVTNQGGVYTGVMRPVDVIRMTPIVDSSGWGSGDVGLFFPARVSRLTTIYKRSPGMTGQSYFVHPDTWHHREWEQELWQAPDDRIPRLYDNDLDDGEPFAGAAPMEEHATSPVKTLFGEQEYDALGNLKKELLVNPQGGFRTTMVSYHPPDWSHWRLGQKKTVDTAAGQMGHSVEPRHVELEYQQGLLWKVHVEKDHSDAALRSTLTIDRNSDGSVTRITRSAEDVPDRFDTFDHGDPERMFVTRTANALGHATRTLTHPALGVVVASRDPNDVLTTRQINDRGMVTRVRAGGNAPVTLHYADRASNGITVSASSAADSSVALTEYDLRGRLVASHRSGFDGTVIHTKSVYDKLGREILWSIPAYGQPGASQGHRTFDSLGRITGMTPPGGFTTTYEHTFLTTEITTPGDPDTLTRITRDLDGRTASSEQYDAESEKWLETTYVYGDFDLLRKVIDPEENVTSFEYDKLGRRTGSDEPDAGHTFIHYDGLGNVTKKGLGGSTTEYTDRDALGRLREQVNDDGVTTFTWDDKPHGIGKLGQSVSPDGVAHDFTYDVYSRPKSETWTVDGTAYTFTSAYDIHGRPKLRSYPTSTGGLQVKVARHYNPFGHLHLIDGVDPTTQLDTPFWQTYAVAATGGITNGLFGNGVTAERSYDPETGRLDWIKDVGVLFQSFTYDFAGRVKSQEEASGRREEFTYDSLARLATWTLFPKGHADGTERVTTFHYDPLGSLLSEDIHQAGNVDTIVHSSGVSLYGPHTAAGPHTFDDRGRLENPNGRTTTYTEFDLPRQIGETHFRYDAEGTRVSKVGPAGTVITLGGLYERHIDAQGTTDVYKIPGPEGVVAQISLNPAEPNGGKVTYVHGGRKGSVHVASSAAGVTEPTLYYDPFGARITFHGTPVASVPGDLNIGYSGLDHDYDLGLINQRGRVYNPLLRRFLTPDPIVSNPLNGQTWNPYSYVRNDPVNRIDPSGYCDSSPCQEGGFIGADGGWRTPMDQADAASQYYSQGAGAETDQGAGATFATATTTRQAAPQPPASIGINEHTATPIGTTSWAPSHKLRLWTGPFTSAHGELQGIADSTPNNLEWACAKACQLVISGLALFETIPNAPDLFYSGLESAATVKYGATAGDRATSALTTGGYVLDFVSTASLVAGPLSELRLAGTASMSGTLENGATIHYSSTATAIGEDANTLQNFARSRGAAGHDLIIHGRIIDGEAQFWAGMPTHPQQVADALLGNPAYRPSMPVQLVTCHGACGLAQELEGILGAPVRAFPGKVQLNPSTGLLEPVPW